MSTRLSKVVAALLPCSRREAEQYIANGWVRVDGVVVEWPQHPIGDERVELDPDARLEPVLPATLIWHKPADLDTTEPHTFPSDGSRRSPGDSSPQRVLQRHFRHLELLFPLETQASGIVLLTQNAALAARLNEDHARYEQECIVEVRGDTVAGGLAGMAQGVGASAPVPKAIKVSWQSEQRLRVAAKGLHPGQLGAMCAAAGLQALSIRRIRLGRLPVASLAAGEWRYLGSEERL